MLTSSKSPAKSLGQLLLPLMFMLTLQNTILI